MQSRLVLIVLMLVASWGRGASIPLGPWFGPGPLWFLEALYLFMLVYLAGSSGFLRSPPFRSDSGAPWPDWGSSFSPCSGSQEGPSMTLVPFAAVSRGRARPMRSGRPGRAHLFSSPRWSFSPGPGGWCPGSGSPSAGLPVVIMLALAMKGLPMHPAFKWMTVSVCGVCLPWLATRGLRKVPGLSRIF
jgi:hypothetical protein